MHVVYDLDRPDLGGNIRHGDTATWCSDLWDLLIELYGVRTALDVGCGEGHAVAYLNKKGIYAVGVDGLMKNIERSVFPIVLHDLLGGPFIMPVDLVWSSEVAEHIPEWHVDNYNDTLCNRKVIAMTHAVPGQVGHNHVNCQASDYWIEKMALRGYTVSLDLEIFREVSKRRGFGYYFNLSGTASLKN